MAVILISSERFAEHQTPPGHPERPERAEVMDVVANRWRAKGVEVVASRWIPTPTRRRNPARLRCWRRAPSSTASSA